MKLNFKIRYFPAILFILFISYGCKQETPWLSLGLNDIYYLQRMQSYRFVPGYTGGEYKWTLHMPDGRDSLLSTERYCTFVQGEEGTYDITFEIIDEKTPYIHNFQVQVTHEYVEYSPYITRVLEYCPAPGQFINEMPKYEPGDTPETMRRKVEENISGRNDVMISLGGYGGYVTFGFDHTVMNVPGEHDFAIYGNAFYSLVDVGKMGGSCEPGIVMVSFDKNCNGVPDDDEWYELAGNEYYKPETLKEYSITYRRPDPDKIPVPDPTGQITDITYIPWSDNRNNTGYITRNRFHSQEYYPQWISGDEMTFKGTCLANNGEDISGMGTYWVLYAYDWGYADNHPNDSTSLVSFDIDWAVDKQGKPVKLPGIDFVRVYTAVNQTCGWIGETSTEIVRAQDLHIQENNPNVPVTPTNDIYQSIKQSNYILTNKTGFK